MWIYPGILKISHTYIHTYIIGHYHPSVRIIDLVAHTLFYPHYKSGSSETNEYQNTTTEKGQKNKSHIFEISDEE